MAGLFKVDVSIVPEGTEIVINSSGDNVVDVAIQDQYTEIIDLKMFEVLNNITIIGTPQVGERTIRIESVGVIPSPGEILCLKSDDTDAFMQPVILTVTPVGGDQYDIYMDLPLDYAFDSTDGCALGNPNWAVDGSITPVKFILSPSGNVNGTSWDLTRITFSCLGLGTSTPSDPTPDDTSFFTMDPINNGIYLRVVDGYTKNIFNVKSNHGVKLRVGGDLEIIQTPNKNGFYSTTARRTFNGPDKNGVTIRLDSDTNDTFELVVQDDLTDMALCEAVVQGHIVD